MVDKVLGCVTFLFHRIYDVNGRKAELLPLGSSHSDPGQQILNAAATAPQQAMERRCTGLAKGQISSQMTTKRNTHEKAFVGYCDGSTRVRA
jgi:hypothetical protein